MRERLPKTAVGGGIHIQRFQSKLGTSLQSKQTCRVNSIETKEIDFLLHTAIYALERTK